MGKPEAPSPIERRLLGLAEVDSGTLLIGAWIDLDPPMVDEDDDER